jgi:UDP-2,3-diacylglucosamine hydrolase
MGKPPFPAPDTLIAPPSWRCIDFISDLHLHEGLPRTTEALSSYLRSTPADAVLILGDLFEAWVGDDMRQQPYEAHCTHLLNQAAQRLYLGIMVGNRDFLLGQAMLSACHAHPLGDPTLLDAWGERLLLVHGDALCLADQAYLRFRSQVRQPAWQTAFLANPLDARLAQARQMRDASQAHQQGKVPQDWADVDEAAAARWMQAADAPTLIHGHTHRPQTSPFGGAHQLPSGQTRPRVRHVLSDWDLDHGPARAEVLRLRPEGIRRLSLADAGQA